MSDYRYFQKKHPEWPKRFGDIDKRYGRLKFDIENRGGTKFAKGDIVLIDSGWRGRLGIIRGKDEIRGVGCGMVELLPEAYCGVCKKLISHEGICMGCDAAGAIQG